MTHLLNIIRGICIGIADAIPGVSGGTIAFILGIYDRFLDAIDLKPKKLIKNLPFLIPLCFGIALGLVIAAKLLGYLFTNHNIPTQFFFIGIIVGSLPMIYRECTAEHKLKTYHAVPFLLSMAAILVINSLSESSGNEIGPVMIIIATALSAASMLIPGLSGALVLKILGGYDTAMQAVSDLDIGTLVFYMIGAAIGLLGAAKIISLLLQHFRRGTYCAILGLIVGSIPKIYPGFVMNIEGIIAVVLLVFGLALPTLMELPGKNSKNDPSDEKPQDISE